MKLLPLYDLQQEINRLFIAGSKFAYNDPRLKRQAAVFNKLGEKLPVLKKLAEGIEALVNADPNDSAAKLLELSTLLYAVLYTQGETVETEQSESDLEPLLQWEDVFTNNSYQELQPVIEALTVSESGRMRQLQKIADVWRISDFRIYCFLDAALADRYTEFADYIETMIIPLIGKPIIPFILNGFSYEGKPDDVRRFRILRKLGYPDIAEMGHKILAGKSGLLQAEAVEVLKREPENEDLLINLTGDKQKAVRLAAYKALAELNTESAQDTLVQLFVARKKKTDIAELGEILAIRLDDKFIPMLIKKAKADYAQCLDLSSADAKVIRETFECFMTSINSLFNKMNEDIATFYKDVFTNSKYYEVSKSVESKIDGFDLPTRIAKAVANNLEDLEEGFDCLSFLSDNSPWDEFLCCCFRVSAVGKMNKKTVYDRFAQHVGKRLTFDIIAEVLLDQDGKFDSDNIDKRWKKLISAYLE
jgi:hypothetical protein